MEVLLLCDYRPEGAATVTDHINALCRDTGYRVSKLSILGNLPDALDLERFDAILIHYSLILSNDNYVSAESRDKLRAFGGVKAVFIQDEYRWVNRAVEALAYIGADILFTCVPDDEIEKVYSPAALPGLLMINTLTGFVPGELLSIRPLDYSVRKLDIGYRARKLSALFGQLAREKWLIADRFVDDAHRRNLLVDISCRESDRLYGQDWIHFMRNCRAMLGSESGASIFDFKGHLQPAIEQYEREHPEASFEEIEDRFFKGQDGLIRMNQISPRCFEAAALRTLMILYEGHYSGALQPWRHYVPLKKDHSNMDEIIAALRDRDVWTRIVECAYEEVACNPAWSYRMFGQQVGAALAKTFSERKRPFALPYSAPEFMRATTMHQLALNANRNIRGRLISLVEKLPGPVFRVLKTIRRTLGPRR